MYDGSWIGVLGEIKHRSSMTMASALLLDNL